MPRNRLIAVLGMVGVLAALTGAYAVSRLQPPTFHGTYLGPSAPTDFTLEAADRGAVSLSDFRGRAVLVFFGYTSCPDICPTAMARLDGALELLGDRRSDVQVVLVTVDPEVDTPHRLREYVQGFDLGFVGLGGERAELAAVAKRFGIYVGEAAEAGTGDGGPGTVGSVEAQSGHAGHRVGATDPRLIPHTSHILGFDRSGALRVLWAPDVTAEQIARDLPGLLRL